MTQNPQNENDADLENLVRTSDRAFPLVAIVLRYNESHFFVPTIQKPAR
jgi:hypothetical protein